MTGFLCVCIGAAVGAPARYLVDRFIQSRRDTVMPWGTLSVNVLGTLVLGLLTGLAAARDVPAEVLLAVGTGLCGAFTTYSTFGYESLRLFEDGARLLACLNVAVTLAAGLAAAIVGCAVGAAL